MITALEFLRGSAPKDPALVVVTGAEEFLRSEVIAAVRAGQPDDLELRRMDGSDPKAPVALADFLDELRTREMFGGDKLVHLVLADAMVKKEAKRITAFLEGGEAVQRMLIEGEKLLARGRRAKVTGALATIEKRGGLIVQCDSLYDSPFGGRGPAHDSPLSRWVQQRAKHHGKTMDLETAYLMQRFVGNRLRELDAELGKLALALGSEKMIRPEDIRETVAAGRLAPVFDLVDAVCGGKLERALDLSDALFERGMEDSSGRATRDPTGIVMAFLGAFASRLRTVGRAIEMMDAGTPFDDVARAVAQAGPFKEQFRALVQATGGADAVARRVRATRELERGMKSGAGAPRALFDLFVYDAIGVRGSARRRA